jgi:excisionase family DNA binding protein
VTVQEAAKVLELRPSVVYRLCAEGRLSHLRVGFGRGVIRITQDNLDAYIASCRIEASHEAKGRGDADTPATVPVRTGLAIRSITGEREAERQRRRLAAPDARRRGGGRS